MWQSTLWSCSYDSCTLCEMKLIWLIYPLRNSPQSSKSQLPIRKWSALMVDSPPTSRFACEGWRGALAPQTASPLRQTRCPPWESETKSHKLVTWQKGIVSDEWSPKCRSPARQFESRHSTGTTPFHCYWLILNYNLLWQGDIPSKNDERSTTAHNYDHF